MHPQSPHIQKYTAINRLEFMRTELGCIADFSTALESHANRIGKLLELSRSQIEQTPMEILLEHMEQTMRTGATNQFTHAQIAMVKSIEDPMAYYGRTVGQQVFDLEPEGSRSGRGDSQHGADSAPSPPDPTADELLRVKLDVLSHSVRHHQSRLPKVVVMTLLKAKTWLAAHEPHVSGSSDALGFCSQRHRRAFLS